ncbi:hypothetical protein KXV85_003840, partial [Aspergillus fumigatus]
GDLTGIVRARRLSRATMRNIRQNLFFAFAYNAAGIPIAAGLLYPTFGLLLSPIVAAAAMALSSVSVYIRPNPVPPPKTAVAREIAGHRRWPSEFASRRRCDRGIGSPLRVSIGDAVREQPGLRKASKKLDLGVVERSACCLNGFHSLELVAEVHVPDFL